jgi:hypothetical protein
MNIRYITPVVVVHLLLDASVFFFNLLSTDVFFKHSIVKAHTFPQKREQLAIFVSSTFFIYSKLFSNLAM